MRREKHRPNRGVRYFPSHDAWYAFINGQRHKLAKGKGNRFEAEQKYLAVCQEAQRPAVRSGTVAEVCADWLAKLAYWDRRPNTIKIATRWLGKLAASSLGTRQADSLTPDDVIRWMAAHPGWGSGTRRIIIIAVKAAWGRKGAKLSNLADLDRLPSNSRDESCLITDEQHAALLAVSPPALADMLVALHETGARPGTIRSVEAQEWRGDEWRLKPKPGRKIHRSYVVLLTPTMTTMCARLAAAHPTGPMFRGLSGKPWTERSLRGAFAVYRRRAGLPSTITAYSYRHAFATKHANRGMKPRDLAFLMATSVAMVERYYDHPDLDHARQAFRRFVLGD